MNASQPSTVSPSRRSDATSMKRALKSASGKRVRILGASVVCTQILAPSAVAASTSAHEWTMSFLMMKAARLAVYAERKSRMKKPLPMLRSRVAAR
eukprot:scaffold2504_cov65-Phaeocystis_antarctica.AAC.6